MDAADQTTPFQIDALLAEVGELRSAVRAQARRPAGNGGGKVVHFS
jgi:hypothetical protein